MWTKTHEIIETALRAHFASAEVSIADLRIVCEEVFEKMSQDFANSQVADIRADRARSGFKIVEKR
jgi:hypothetical protein